MLPDLCHCRALAILFAACLWRPAHAKPAPVAICAELAAEGRSLDTLKGCGVKWAIKNRARVPEFWEVHELRFFWNAECTVGLPNAGPFSSSVMSTKLGNVAANVYDSNLVSRWSSNCRVLLGGCPPMREHVGQTTEGNVPVNLDKNSPYANVRCAKIFQTPNVTRQASDIALVTWINETEYHVVQEYGAFTGGVWQKRPSMEHGLWRIWNAAKTERPWRIYAFMFYSDAFCTMEETGVVISSTPYPPDNCIDSRTCDKYNATSARGGVVKPGLKYPDPVGAYWMADCPWWYGCDTDAAWIGLDFGEAPKTIRCVRIWQPANPAYPDKGLTSHAEELRMQSWDGYKWLDSDYYKGLGMGGWNDTRPGYKNSWRLSNFDKTASSWQVYEVEFHADVNCGEREPNGALKEQILGVPISANPVLPFREQEQTCRLASGSCAGLAFDKLTDTNWVSSCARCAQREAWIGMYFRGKGGTEVRCFKVLQHSELDHMSPAIELAFWDGEEWKPSRHEIGVGGGTWNHRPAGVSSMYRILSNSITEQPWTLMGFAMYNDTNCLTEMPGTPIVSGAKMMNPVEGAFDDDEYTYWETSCSPPKPGAKGCALNSAWIGIQGPRYAIDVRCLRIQQHRSRERQVTSVRSQEWDGMTWKGSRLYPEPFRELSGGKWQMLPGLQGSMWRLAAMPASWGAGFGVTEIEFFRSPDCSTGQVKAAFPNAMPICSAFATAREVASATGYEAHLREIGDFAFTEPNLAFDGNLATFWADLTTKDNSWVGLDLTTQVVDIHCTRISLAGVRTLQVDHAELQAWDGKVWATKMSAISPWTKALPAPIPFPSGSGWQKRPALEQSMWRIQNDNAIPGWEIQEVELYRFVDCSGKPMTGQAISSLPVMTSGTPKGGHTMAAAAFDGDTATRWTADCKPHKGTCQPGDAWVGLDAHVPTITTCFRLIQSGRRYLQASKIAMAKWDGNEWAIVGRYSGFGGESWNRRPAAPDTLWRVSFVRQKRELCEEHGRGMYMRSWGVSELEFYSDDECSVKLPGLAEGALVVTSGTREPNTAIRAKTPQFDPKYAFDGSIKSYWAAQCGNVHGSDEAFCAAGYEWIGLDFGSVEGGQPRDVRCFKIHQNRNSRRECCDPAEELQLERWNGTDWAVSGWRHVPLDGTDVMTIPGRFDRTGMCPLKVTDWQPGGGVDYWEERVRRQSEACIVPLAASVKLLSDPLCDKHQACVDAGFAGQCCPAKENAGLSRCCCDFLMSGTVFEDELTKDAERKPIETAPPAGIEFIVIKSVVVLPFIGLAVAVLLLFIGNVPRPRVLCLMRPWLAVCEPLQRWMASKVSPGAAAMNWMVVRHKGERPNAGRVKMLVWLVVGFVGGGCIFWMLISYIIAEVFIKLTVITSMVIPFCKSPYSPGDPADRKRMAVMLALPFESDSQRNKVKMSASPLGDIGSKAAKSLIFWILYMMRAMWDFILMRFALLALGLVDVNITVPEILAAMPKMPIDIAPVQDLMYSVVSLTTKMFQECFLWLFEGVPRCEGPVILFSGMWLVAVTLVLIRWLNYDIFGVFTSSKNVIGQTRPMFQKTCGVGLMLAIQAVLFIFMQCIMLLFVRALKLVNPTETSNQQWTCPYGDDFMSIAVGRVLLTGAALVALGVTFLCANGHFLGQDYIVKDFSKWIDMNLSGLDPDGAGPDGGFIRFDTLLAMIPTTFGIWIDGWNVKGYLIKERALVYAEEMELPIECPVCQIAHVPYAEVMRASGMQLSIAYQLAPCGAIIGKACEYLNNPPLFYWGKELKCFHAHRHMTHAMEGVPKKLGTGQMGVVAATLFLAFCKDMLIPFLVRILGLGMYIVLVYMTVMIDRNNVKSMASSAFQAISAIALTKAMLEFVLPVTLLFIFFLVMRLSSSSNGAEQHKERSKKPKTGRNAWPVIGATVNGMATGLGVTLFFLLTDPLSFGTVVHEYSVMIGTVCGACGSLVALGLALILEQFPFSRIFASGLLFAYLVISSLGLGWLGTSKHYTFMERLIMSMGACLVLVSVSGYCFWPPSIPKGGPKAMINIQKAIHPVVSGPRLLSAPMGTIGGVFVAAKLYDMCIRLQGEYWGFGTAVLCGLITSLLYALATDSIIEKRSAQVAVGLGTALSVVIGVYAVWYIGVGVGSVVGCIAGAVVEHQTMKAVMAETVLMVPGDAQPFKPTQRSDGSTMYPDQPAKQLPAIMERSASDGNLPTLVRVQTNAAELNYYDNYESPTGRDNQLSMRSSKGKRFGLGEKAFTSNALASPGATHTGTLAWMAQSPESGPSPSSVAMTQGYIGTPSNWAQPAGTRRSVSSPPGGNSREGSRQSSARGATQGGLPTNGRPAPKPIASVVRDVS